MHHPTDRISHTTAFVTPFVEHWLEREIAQWVHHEGSIRQHIAPRANALTTELHLAPDIRWRVHILKDSTYHGLCYTSRGALAGTRNSSMGPPWRIDPTTHHTTSKCSYHKAIHLAPPPPPPPQNLRSPILHSILILRELVRLHMVSLLHSFCKYGVLGLAAAKLITEAYRGLQHQSR